MLCAAVLGYEGLDHEKVAYIFEKGDRQHEIDRVFIGFEKDHPQLAKKRSISFFPKSTWLLQPADLIAGKIQELLLRAHSKLGFLDNGDRLTHIDSFGRYNSLDGTTEALLKTKALHFCFVANRKHYEDADMLIARIFSKRPIVKNFFEKQFANQGKRKKRVQLQHVETESHAQHRR